MILIDLTDIQNYPKCKIPCKCNSCNSLFDVKKAKLKYGIKTGFNVGIYCSKKCGDIGKIKSMKVECCYCKTEFTKHRNQIKKTNNNFCSRSCAATYNNTHKTKGNRRSKLEIWIEDKLKDLYPKLEIGFSCKNVINSELDIYIPSIKLGIEINGIHHSKPIYGKDKLEQVKANDIKKLALCKLNKIELLSLDTTTQLRFKEETSIAFLDIIRNAIDVKLVGASGYAPD